MGATTTATRGTLTETQIRQFIVDGYLILTPDLDSAYHERIYRRATELMDAEEALGEGPVGVNYDRVRAQVPEIDVLFADDRVRGALTSILGPDPLFHSHSVIHTTSEADQTFHKDTSAFNTPGRSHIRSHRPDWLLCNYYPQDTTLELGPTEIIAGSQYWTTDWGRNKNGMIVGQDSPGTLEEFMGLRTADIETRQAMLEAQLARLDHPWLRRHMLVVPAGSVVLVHQDMFHRGSRRSPEATRARYLVKFVFARTRQPVATPWIEDATAAFPTEPVELQRVWPHIRAAMAGDDTPLAPPDEPVSDLLTRLTAATDPVRVDAAYALADVARAGGPAGDQALSALVDTLRSDVESYRRCAAYGLAAAGPTAADVTAPLLAVGTPHGRAHAAFVLGETATTTELAVVLTTGLDDEDPLVRAPAAAALGRLAQRAIAENDRALWEAAAEPVARHLDPAVEPGLGDEPRSSVRQSLAHALVSVSSLGPARGGWITDELADASVRGLTDPDRHVQASCAEAARRLLRAMSADHPRQPWLRDSWEETLLARRWSPT